MAEAVKEVAAGFFAGVADALVSHPIDQVKTQFQVSRNPNGSVVTALAEQYAKGGIFRLYRGIFAACLRPQALCMYTGNLWSSNFVGSLDTFTDASTGKMTIFGSLVAGVLTGLPEAAGVTPFELVKVRMQSLEHVGRFKDSADCARALLRSEGLGALYTGFGATCARNCTFNGIYFMMIYATREKLALPQDPITDFAVGCWSAFLATVVKLPADIAKSRIQNDIRKKRKYRNVLQCLNTVVQEEGAAALYKGFVPTSLRMMLGQGVSFLAFEWAMRQLSENSPTNE